MEDICDFRMKYEKGIRFSRYFALEIENGNVAITIDSFDDDGLGMSSLELIDVEELLGPALFPPGLLRTDMEALAISRARERSKR